MIEVECKVPEYEVDDTVILVKNHWNRNSLIELIVDGKKHIVNGSELTAAIDNASNTARY